MSSAPFYSLGAFGDEMGLIVAFVIGIAFGFFLEKAGFGNARKLAAQFYLRDLAVLKVMFTAIVTAMVGLAALSWIGFLDLSLVYLTPTFLVPQVVGGLILGVGFVVGGYCPGTSVVSAAIGRLDGMVYVLGMLVGLFVYGEIYPLIQGFTTITPMGQTTLAAYFGISYNVLVFGVVVMAVCAFAAAEWAEGFFGGLERTDRSLTTSHRGWNMIRILAVALGALGLGGLVMSDPGGADRSTVHPRELALEVGSKADHISVEDLAGWLIEGKIDFQLIDVRAPADFAAYHIPAARSVALATLDRYFAPHNEKLILYSEGGIHAAQAWFLLKSMGYHNVYLLDGGLDAWKDEILFPRAPAEGDASAVVRFDRLAAMSRFFGGQPRGVGASAADAVPEITAPPVPVAPIVPTGGQRPKRQGC